MLASRFKSIKNKFEICTGRAAISTLSKLETRKFYGFAGFLFYIINPQSNGIKLNWELNGESAYFIKFSVLLKN